MRRMRLNLFQQFSLVSLLVIGLSALSGGYIISYYLTKDVIYRHGLHMTQMLQAQVKEHRLFDIFNLPELRRDPEKLEQFILPVRAIPDVVRVKVWDREGTIIWADEPRLIGKAFPENKELKEALRGTTQVELKEMKKEEQLYERERFPSLIEVYAPIFAEEGLQVIGAVEVYNDPAFLLERVRQGKKIVWTGSLLAGLLLYLSLFGIVKRAYSTQLRLEEELEGYASGLEQKVAERTRELNALIKAGHTVSSSLDLEDILKDVVFLAAQVMDISTVVLMLLDEKEEELICRAQIGLPDEWLREERHRVGEGLSGLVALEGRPLSALEIASDHRTAHQDMARKYGFVSYLGVPVKVKERLIGVLSILTKRPRPFTENEISLLSTFADQAGIAIENARLFETELRLLREAQERRRLEEVSRIRSEFIAHVSHELRTPLNAIIGFSELLFDGKAGELSEKQSRYMGNVLESGKHLLNIINDIIDISKVDTGKIELRPEEFLLQEALEASLAIIKPQAEGKGLTLRLDFDPRLRLIKADPVRFKQVMYNLLSNAIKFTPEGGQVRVTAQLVRSPMSDVRSQEVAQGLSPELRTTAHLVHGPVASELVSDEDVADELRRYKNFVQITVQDTGIGIKPEDISKLFKEFSQIESVYTKKYQGTGLGLALTKRLVELHGGRIWVESEGEGRGSTFTFILPLGQGIP